MKSVRYICWLIVGVSLTCADLCRAESGGSSFASPVHPSHGWVILQNQHSTTPRPGAVLAHLPPRDAAGKTPGSTDGSLHYATRLNSVPTDLAAVGDQIYLVFRATPLRAGQEHRRVVSLQAVPTGIGPNWAFVPEARLKTHPSLPGTGRLIGFAASARGPTALIADPDLVLLVLRPAGWERLALPGPNPAIGALDPSMADELWLLDTHEAPALLGRWGEVWGMWSGGFLGSPVRAGPPSLRIRWSWNALRAPPLELKVSDGEVPTIRRTIHSAFFLQDRIIIEHRAGDTVRLIEIGDHDPIPLFETELAAQDEILFPVRSETLRVVLVRSLVTDPAPNAKPRPGGYPPTDVRIRELTLSGQSFYDGPIGSTPPITARDFRVVAVSLFFLTLMLVGWIVFGGRGEEDVSLPMGTALAEPPRRFAAAMIDVLIILGIVSVSAGIAPWEIASFGELTVLLSDPRVIFGLPVVGILASSITEWSSGRSLGKMLLGLHVISASPKSGISDGEPDDIDHRKISFGMSVVRNLVRWLLPPLAMIGVMTPGSRHLGDRLAKSLVIIRHPDRPGDQGNDEF